MKHKFVRMLTSLILGFTLAMTQMSPAYAASYVVNDTSDAVDVNPGDGTCATSTGVCTLRAAVMESNAQPSDDTITLPAGTYQLSLAGSNEDAGMTGDLDIKGNLIINGAGETSTIIDGDGGVFNDRVIHITGAFTVSITGTTIMGGTLGGIFSANGSELNLTNSTVRDNTTPYNGGGIRMDGSSKLTLNNSTINNNNAVGGSGGGIFSTGTDTIINSTISTNTAQNGGGIYIFPGGSVDLINSAVTANQALIGYGGGISNTLNASLTLTATTVSGNTASYLGGGIANDHGATASLTGSTVSNNSAPNGGGIGNLGLINITNSQISNNSGYTGGGIYNENNVSLNKSIVSENTTSVSGSGIRNRGTLSLRDTMVMNNSATSNGVSGAGITNEGNTVMFNSSIVDNTATNNGAGITNFGVFRLVNSTVSGNSPGGIVNASTLEMYNVTVTNNASNSVGGGLFNFSYATLQNTIIGGNFGSAGPSDCFGTLTSGGYNLIQNTTGCTISGDTTGNILGVDPILAPLQDNGGPTLTHALLTGSPAIDAGNPTGCKEYHRRVLTVDQRGVSRPQGTACDIGAFEYVPPIVVSIDIKPGSDTNPINPNSNGNIPVAILSTPDFDAPSVVDVSSLTFGRFGNEESLVFCNDNGEDVNGDGLLDLVCHFDNQLTVLVHPKYRYGNLKGYTVDGTPLKGKDSVTIIY